MPSRFLQRTIYIFLILTVFISIKSPLEVNLISINFLRTINQPLAIWNPAVPFNNLSIAAQERLFRYQLLAEIHNNDLLDKDVDDYYQRALSLRSLNPIAILLLSGYLYQNGQVSLGESLLLHQVALDCQFFSDASVFWQRPVKGIQIPVNDETRNSFSRIALSLLNQLDRCSPETIIQVGRMSMFSLGETELAHIWFQRSLEIYPENDGLLYHLFVLSLWCRQYEQALFYLHNLEELQSGSIWIDDYNLNLQLGQIYANIPGMSEMAVLSYQKALRIKPQDPYLYVRIAQVYERENQFSLAIEIYRQVLNLPFDPRVNQDAIYLRIEELEKRFLP